MKIYIWGTGFAAKELLETDLKEIVIEAYIDNNRNYDCPLKPIISPEEAVNMEIDAVIVATGYSKEIYAQAINLGFDISKFIFIYNNYFFKDMNQNYILAESILPHKLVEIMKTRYHVIRGMMQDEVMSQFCLGNQRNEDMYENDYNRIRTFELIVREIYEENIMGAVAELGVFRGEFAKYINAAFPNKVCYLFDTFEGFRDSEAEIEKNKGNCGNAFVNRFKNTQEEIVLLKMPFPENIVCKKGLFPESLQGLEENFAFVSLDVDFEQSIYDGLEYFYPRLSGGGYIFIHDYNSSTLRGVRNAVSRYEKDKSVCLSKVPIPDLCGTLVITK